MKCPYCMTEFALTWQRYFKAPFGKHICPSCKKKSKLRHIKKYILYSLLPLSILFGCLLFLFFHLSGDLVYTVFLAIGISLAIGLPFDRYLDNKLGHLTQIKDSDNA